MGINLSAQNFSGVLSALEIDDDKDWGGYDISNMGDLDTIGTDFMLNGDFDSADDWDWTGGDGDWYWNTDHAELTIVAAHVSSLISDTSIASGKKYLLIFEVSNNNVDLDVSVGGVSIPTIQAKGTSTTYETVQFVVDTTSTAALTFQATVVSVLKARCRIDSVSIQAVGMITGFIDIRGGTLNATLDIGADGTYDLGSDGYGIKKIWLGVNAGGSSPPSAATGLTAKYATGDMYIGNDNVYPGYYVQKTMVHNSTATDNSDDYTNLYQGDSGYPRIAMMYDIPWNSLYSGAWNGVEINPTEDDSVPLLIGDKFFLQQLDGSASKFVLDGETMGDISFLEINLNHGTNQEAVRPGTHDKIDIGDLANTLMFRNGYFSGVLDAIGGFAVNTTPGHTGWIDDGVNFRATITGGIITNVHNSIAGGWA